MTKKRHQLEFIYPFIEYQPIQWVPPGNSQSQVTDSIYSIKRDHGIKGTYCLHNPNDEINEGRDYLDKVVIEYKIDTISYDLFTIGDFFEVNYSFNEKAEGNIMGDVAERIARRITKYFLKHHSKHGYTGGIFDKRFNPQERNNFIVTNTNQYILKIQKYPNLVILKKTGIGKFGYENIKELDGLFDYRYNRKRHILVLESKMDKININSDSLIFNLFLPLKQLFTNAEFTYVLFAEKKSLYRKKNMAKLRQLKHQSIDIYKKLKKYNIGILFLSFNESRDDFRRMKDHLITQYRLAVKLDVQLYGKMVLSDKKIVLFDEGQTPRIKLYKDHQYGMWKEVKLYHKMKR